jgi:hypothetical protein
MEGSSRGGRGQTGRSVTLPAFPDAARLDLRVALDPILVEARVTYSAPNEQGIRRAHVVASTPSWAALRFDRVEQAPDLCASPALGSLVTVVVARLFGDELQGVSAHHIACRMLQQDKETLRCRSSTIVLL